MIVCPGTSRLVLKSCARALVAAALLTVFSGCSHLPRPHWPWHHEPAPPQVVHELVITGGNGSELALPQYWSGNTLVVDLRLAGAEGTAILKPREHTFWPVRIAFRVLPRQFASLEIQAAQRVVLPITTSGTKPVDMELAPGVFIMKSPQIQATWGPGEPLPAEEPAPTPPAPATPGPAPR